MSPSELDGPEAMVESLREKARLASLRADISGAFNRTGELDPILQACTEALVDNLDAAFARIWVLDKPGEVLELKASAGLYTHLDGPHGRVKMGDFKIGRIAANVKPHISNSVPTDPEVSNPEWARREGMISFAGYPLTLEGQVLGVVAFFSRTVLSPEILNELAPIADGIAQWVKRKQAEMELREQREWLSVTLRSIGDALVTTDTSGHVTFLNPVAEALTGWTSAEALNQRLETVFNVVHEKTHEPVENPVAKALREKRMVGFGTHTLLIRKTGEETAIEDSASLIRSQKSEILGAILVFHDITARRKSERLKDAALQQAQDARRETEILNRVGRNLASESELAKVVQMAVDAGRELTGATFGAFYYKAAHDEGDEYRHCAFSGITPEDFGKLGLSPSAPLVAPIFAGSGILRINDMKQHSIPGARKLAEPLAFNSFMAASVVSRSGSVLGGLLFGHVESWRFSIIFARLIEGIAAQSAIAIDYAHLSEALTTARAKVATFTAEDPPDAAT